MKKKVDAELKPNLPPKEVRLKMSHLTLRLGALVFAILAFVHLWRVFFPFHVEIGNFSVPTWASGLFFLFAASLSAWILHVDGEI